MFWHHEHSGKDSASDFGPTRAQDEIKNFDQQLKLVIGTLRHDLSKKTLCVPSVERQAQITSSRRWMCCKNQLSQVMGKHTCGSAGQWMTQIRASMNHCSRTSGAKDKGILMAKTMGVRRLMLAGRRGSKGSMGPIKSNDHVMVDRRVTGASCMSAIWTGIGAPKCRSRTSWHKRTGHETFLKWILSAKSMLKVALQCAQVRRPGRISRAGTKSISAGLSKSWHVLRCAARALRPIISWHSGHS